jgi:hypothetical protein
MVRDGSFPCFNNPMCKLAWAITTILLMCALSSAQVQPNAPAAKPAEDYSGMFLLA